MDKDQNFERVNLQGEVHSSMNFSWEKIKIWKDKAIIQFRVINLGLGIGGKLLPQACILNPQ